MKKEYVCECGKRFDKPNSFNGHKRNCKVHFEVNGKLDSYVEAHNKLVVSCKAAGKRIKAENEKNKMSTWIAEEHHCEKCGKLMTQKFGTGRFCCTKCANSREHSLSDRLNIAESMKGEPLSVEDIIRISLSMYFPPLPNVKYKYTGPQLPSLEKETLTPGYQSRSRKSYAEKFWQKVLDNNHISYVVEFPVRCKHNNASYRLDFLINDNIDLEIDGEQHFTPEAALKDAERTKQLQEQGYIVYRIRWINPNTEKNKIIVKSQVDDLLYFISQNS